MFPKTRKLAAMGLILLLIAVYPANIYLAVENGAPLKLEAWQAWARLPLQFVLIYWTYFHWKTDTQ